MKRIKKKSCTTSSRCFTVIKFIENNIKLFDCIPDIWFTNENKESCLWPPPKGKNVAILALKQELPDDSWETYDCEVVKEGFATYSLGRALVREKCLQTYNTSSAEEHLEAAKFRRKHPGLSFRDLKSFEDVFATENSVKTSFQNQKDIKGNAASKHDFKIRKVANVSQHLLPEYRKNSLSKNRSSTSAGNVSAIRENSQDANIGSQHKLPDSDVTRGSPSGPHKNSLSTNRSSISAGNVSAIRENSQDANIGFQYKLPDSNVLRRSPSAYRRKSPNSNGSLISRSIDDTISSVYSTRNSRGSSHPSRRSARSRSNISSRRSSRNSSRPSRRTAHSRSNISSRRSSRRSSCRVSSQPSRRSERSRSNISSRRSNPSSSQRSSRKSCRNSIISSFSSANSESRNTYTAAFSRNSRNDSVSNASLTKRKYSETTSEKHRSSGSQHLTSNAEYRGQISAAGHREESPRKKTVDKNVSNSCSSSCESKMLMKQLLTDVAELSKNVHKNQQQNDRRLTRMEVSINKTLVRLGDITRSNAAHSIDEEPPSNFARDFSHIIHDEIRENPGEGSRFFLSRDRTIPEFPILSLNELTDINKQLKNKEFHVFLVNQEKEFCMPSKNVSDNVVMTNYLKRCISLRVRSLLTLKSGDGLTLFADFHCVYLFLIDVLQKAYRSCNKSLTEKEAHETLRIVWGRSKQLLNDQQKKRK